MRHTLLFIIGFVIATGCDAPPPSAPENPSEILLEAENGSGDGQIMPRSEASNRQTVWLHSGETRTLLFATVRSTRYSISVRYSNDNFGPLETVDVSMGDTLLGSFRPQDTGDFGFGWNVFLWTDSIGPVDLSPGWHSVVLSVLGGDGFGVEIDVVALRTTVSGGRR